MGKPGRVKPLCQSRNFTDGVRETFKAPTAGSGCVQQRGSGADRRVATGTPHRSESVPHVCSASDTRMRDRKSGAQPYADGQSIDSVLTGPTMAVSQDLRRTREPASLSPAARGWPLSA
jgi:hypothetical protein